MIALDPEFVGSLAPPSKLTTTTLDGKPAVEVPFARLPRLKRLRVQGKADETEVVDDFEENTEVHADTKKTDIAEREKRKMRGKGKSLKRSASNFHCSSDICSVLTGFPRYLRKQRKNVIDPAVVCVCYCHHILVG